MKRLTAMAVTLLAGAAAGLAGPAGTAEAAPAPLPPAPATATAGATPAPDASTSPAAASCTGIRYASSSNTIYLDAGTYTPSSIAAACPRVPLARTGPGSRTWLLSADLVVGPGATLNLGPDTGTLRLRSRASSARAEVSALTVRGGTLNATGVTVTSWDDQAGAPDTTPDNVTGPSRRGRAFVRAQSVRDASGTHQGVMNIDRSTFTNLGYYAAESYGVSYKTLFCGREDPEACGPKAVTGRQTSSTFSNNYMGTYFWGARNMRFTGNSYVNNVMYGLNGHDGVRNITISGNTSSGNGNHGIICSQRCDRITITGNTVTGNGRQPWTGPDPDASGPARQVHGIMLHRGTTSAVVSGNTVRDHRNGAGIAVFDNRGATISGNTIAGARFGLRTSVGSARNTFSGNRVTGSLEHAVLSFAGTDPVEYAASARPSGNTFTGNVFSGSGSSIIKLTDSDRFTFSQNTITGAAQPIEITRGAAHVFRGNTLAKGQVFRLRGTAGQRTSVTISPGEGVRADRDGYSTATLLG